MRFGSVLAHDHPGGFHPVELIPYVLVAVAMTIYVVGCRRRGRQPTLGTRTAGLAAVGFYLLAVSPFLHRSGEQQFAWHMVQHLIFTAVVPPLVLLTRPRAPMAMVLARIRWPGRGQQTATTSLVLATTAAVVAMWVWHLPGLYDLAVRSPVVHGLEHATMLSSSMWLWWVAFSRRVSHHAAILAFLVVAVAGGALGALLTFSGQPFYGSHLAVADPLADQQMAGLLMWVPGGLVPMAAAVYLVFDWIRAAEKRVDLRERVRVKAAVPPTVAVWMVAIVVTGGVLSCSSSSSQGTAGSEFGDADRGPDLMADHGCASCHTIPGVTGATSAIGPPLDRFGERRFIAGTLTNDPDNLVQWLLDPDSVRPGTPMPDPGLTEEEAEAIAAYLSGL